MAADSYLKYGQQLLIPTTKRYSPIVSGGGGNNWAQNNNDITSNIRKYFTKRIT
jgi:hypothetical protein